MGQPHWSYVISKKDWCESFLTLCPIAPELDEDKSQLPQIVTAHFSQCANSWQSDRPLPLNWRLGCYSTAAFSPKWYCARFVFRSRAHRSLSLSLSPSLSPIFVSSLIPVSSSTLSPEGGWVQTNRMLSLELVCIDFHLICYNGIWFHRKNSRLIHVKSMYYKYGSEQPAHLDFPSSSWYK